MRIVDLVRENQTFQQCQMPIEVEDELKFLVQFDTINTLTKTTSLATKHFLNDSNKLINTNTRSTLKSPKEPRFKFSVNGESHCKLPPDDDAEFYENKDFPRSKFAEQLKYLDE